MLLKYFLDRQGVATKRIAGRPGSGHIEIATATLGPLASGTDLYQQMFAHGYARVVETDTELLVDCPRPLTARQKDFLKEKELTGKSVSLNSRAFVETRDPVSARQIVEDVCAR